MAKGELRETSRSLVRAESQSLQVTRTKEGQTNAAGAALAVPSGGTRDPDKPSYGSQPRQLGF